MIEGGLSQGDRVAIVEDVITTGGSVLRAIDLVESAGASVCRVLCVVDRGEETEKKSLSGTVAFFHIQGFGTSLGNTSQNPFVFRTNRNAIRFLRNYCR